MINFNKDKWKIEGFEFTDHIEVKGLILKNFINIEESINEVIALYFEPKKDKLNDFFDIMLNSSITNTGAKIKILRNITNFNNTIVDKISETSSIRNSFAHNNIHREISLSEKTGKSKMFVMNSSGIIKIKDQDELIIRYSELSKEIENYIKSYIEDIKK